MESDRHIAASIFTAILQTPRSGHFSLDKIKRKASKEFGIPLIDNTKLFKLYNESVADGSMAANKDIEYLLTVKRIRSQSGVAIVTLLTMPYPCPGKCVYCPDEERMPKSYIENEPAAQRALRLSFDPYLQTAKRIMMLEGNGHSADKIELIIKGGTWSSYPVGYQQWFIKESLRAMNDNGVGCDILVVDEKSPYNRFHGTEKETWTVQQLLDAQKENETAPHRCIGLTIETRPDFISTKEIVRLRLLGCTRVELGVQTTSDTILDLIKRGHSREKVVHATRLLKDAGLKVDYHLMPGLPGATPENDFQSAQDVFQSHDLQPDTIKIYPCVVTPNTELEAWWKAGTYHPYTTAELIPLIARIKSIVPPYVRIARVIRDIPGTDITAGNLTTNLRENIHAYMREQGMVCRCLRCREVGHRDFAADITHAPTFFIRSYDASGGKEYFLSFESEDESTLFAFLRLRLPPPDTSLLTSSIPELAHAGIVRELHTYGHLVAIHSHEESASQHTGLGKKLLLAAEKITRDAGYLRIAIISGIGVREYYKKRGYHLEGTYMIKDL